MIFNQFIYRIWFVMYILIEMNTCYWFFTSVQVNIKIKKQMLDQILNTLNAINHIKLLLAKSRPFVHASRLIQFKRHLKSLFRTLTKTMLKIWNIFQFDEVEIHSKRYHLKFTNSQFIFIQTYQNKHSPRCPEKLESIRSIIRK